MITADPRTKLGYLCREVDEMPVDTCLDVSINDLRDIETYWHNGHLFAGADRILENVVGSAYTHSYTVHPSGQTVTFRRHEDTGKRHYISPDRR